MATPRLDKAVLEAADGGPLRLDIRTSARPGEARPTVVICHGFKGFKDWGMFPKLSERLATAGFTAASFNFSGSGVSEGDQFDEPDRWFRQKPTADLDDIRTVIDHLVSTGVDRIGLIGHSRGGGLAILHAARDARVQALVTWAAIDHFLRWPSETVRKWRETGTVEVVNTRTGQVLPIGLDALDDWDANRDGALDIMVAAQRVRAPWLVVHGSEDATVPAEVGRILAEVSGSLAAELLVVEGADHTFGARHPWAGTTPHLTEVFDRTLDFLSKYLV